MKRALALFVCICLLAGCVETFGETSDGNTFQIGDAVTFGRYYTKLDGELYPIEWLVMKLEDDSALLLSRYALDSVVFNKSGGGAQVNWGNCTIRTWLNETFYEIAFSEEEKQSLLELSSEYSDYVSLTSKITASSNLPDELLCKPTQYAKECCKVKTVDGYCEWWVRDFNTSPVGLTWLFGLDGEETVHELNEQYIGVRPMIKVNLKTAALGEPSEETETTAETEAESSEHSLPSLGQVVTFGTYQIKEANLMSPIQWYVISSRDDAVMLISVYALDNVIWASSDEIYRTLFGGSLGWNDSYLRGYLNGVFLKDAFSEEERAALLTMTLKNDDGTSTSDRVILLSADEAASLFRDLRCEPTPYLKSQMEASSETQYVSWWTRSAMSGTMSGEARYFDSEGKDTRTGVTTALGIRPVIAVDPAWFQ